MCPLVNILVEVSVFFSRNLIRKFEVSSVIIKMLDICGLHEKTAYCFMLSFDYVEDIAMRGTDIDCSLLCFYIYMYVCMYICMHVCLFVLCCQTSSAVYVFSTFTTESSNIFSTDLLNKISYKAKAWYLYAERE